MGLFLFLCAVVVLGSFLFLYSENKRGANELDCLRHGLFGEFDVSAIDNQQDSALAFDRERRKLAFVRTQVPTYNDEGFVKDHFYKTVVCSYDDIASILLIEDKNTKSVVTAQFRFHHEIPPGNLWKQLHHVGSANRLPLLLKAELPDASISVTERKY